jgi:hypothetical protein
MPWDSVLFGFTASLAFFWSIINGFHRRNPHYKQKVKERAMRFTPRVRRRLLRLVAPVRMEDRLNHSAVIAGCCCIIASPLVLVAMFSPFFAWWQPPLIAAGGALLGSVTGELLFNSWGNAIESLDEANPPPSTGAGAGEAQSPPP